MKRSSFGDIPIYIVTAFGTEALTQQDLDDAGVYFGRGFNLYPRRRYEVMFDFINCLHHDEWIAGVDDVGARN